jgi:hypothetical protein
LKAAGINVFNGYKYPPDMKALEILDLLEQRTTIYNRFARIALYWNSFSKEAPLFHLAQPDCYEIWINPCSKKMQLLDIKYITVPDDTFYANINPAECSCLIPLVDKPVNGRWIYELREIVQ